MSRPIDREFRKYVPYFLEDVPDDTCAKAGRAAYFDVSLESVVESDIY